MLDVTSWQRFGLTPALSGVASLEWTTEANEVRVGQLNSTADEEGHVHSNAKLAGSLI